MRIRARDFFSKAEKKRITKSVDAVEAHTTSEIAIALVDESDRYREAEIIGAFAIAGLVSTVACLVLDYSIAFSWDMTSDPNYTSIWFWIPLTAILLPPAWYLLRFFPHLKLVFLSRKRVEMAIKHRSLLSFYQKQLHRTENQTGVLIFISLLERRVRIMGDRGIHGKIGQSFWNERAKELTHGIRRGKTLDALLEVIEKCGKELGRHFPTSSD